jgi:hypothetical protein
MTSRDYCPSFSFNLPPNALGSDNATQGKTSAARKYRPMELGVIASDRALTLSDVPERLAMLRAARQTLALSRNSARGTSTATTNSRIFVTWICSEP